jgi:hypothetical protein
MSIKRDQDLASRDYTFLLDELKRLANDPRIAAEIANHKPAKWLRIPEAARIYGICRSHLYQLICSGKIRSCSLRKSGQARGSRRVLAASLDEYFESNATGGETK